MPAGRRALGASLAALAALVLAVWGHTVGHEFVALGDDVRIVANPRVVPEVSASPWSAPRDGAYAPLADAAWSALARTCGLAPAPFHALNVALHLAAALLAFALLAACTRLALARDPSAAQRWPAGRLLVPLAGAAFFALHPIQAELVSWASGARELLCAALALGALAAFALSCGATAVRRRWYALATAAYVAALLAAPSAAVLPLLAAVVHRAFSGRSWRDAARALAPWLALAAPFAWLALAARPAGPPAHGVEWWLRPLVAIDALAFYAVKIVVPFESTPDYGRTPALVASEGWRNMHLGLALLVAVLLVRGRARIGRFAPLGFGVLWLLPSLGLVPFAAQRFSTVADRYAYLALLAPGLLLAARTEWWTWIGADRALRRRALAAAAVLCVALASVQSWRQALPWRSSTSLFSHALLVEPKSALAYERLGVALLENGDAELARACFAQAVQNDPQWGRALNRLGGSLLAAGELERAREAFERAAGDPSDEARATCNLAAVALREGDVDRAAELFESVLARRPGFARAHAGLAFVHEERGDPAAARAAFERALELDPMLPEANEGIAGFFVTERDLEGARRHVARARRLRPSDPEVAMAVGSAAIEVGALAEGLQLVGAALEGGVGDEADWNNYGWMLHGRGLTEEAIRAYERSIEIRSTYTRARANLATCLAELGRQAEAADTLAALVDTNAADANLFHAIAYHRHEAGQEELARAALERALELDPAHAPSLELQAAVDRR